MKIPRPDPFRALIALVVGVFAMGAVASEGVPAVKHIVVGLHESYPWSYSAPGSAILGQEKEIIEEAFRTQNIEARFQIMSYSRLVHEFQNKRLDFASPVAIEIPGAYYTDKYLPFHDVAVSLASRKVTLGTMADLAGKSVVAYQQAAKVLGPEFSTVVSKGKYQELAERDLQIKLLVDERVDVVVGEARISSCLAESLYGPDRVTVHPVFKQVSYGGASWDKTLADQFQAGLRAIRQSGVYQRILSRPCPVTKQKP